MKDTLTFDFCKITIYEHYVVVVINEGVNLTSKHNKVLSDITETYFANQPFVYITHRINSYSVDPQIYYDTVQIINLKGMAVVSNNYQAKINAKIEKMFFNKPFEIFNDLEDAIEWAETLIHTE